MDIGAAEGLMLSWIKKEFPNVECVGLEYSQEEIDANKDQNKKIIKGDTENLPFQDNEFDVVVAAAIIEHLKNPEKMLSEARRVLKKGGILIVTTPKPFWDKAMTIFGKLTKNRLLTGEEHNILFNMRELKEYFKKANFKVVHTERFLFSPCEFPLEIERIIKFLKLDFILLNQLIVGKNEIS